MGGASLPLCFDAAATGGCERCGLDTDLDGRRSGCGGGACSDGKGGATSLIPCFCMLGCCGCAFVLDLAWEPDCTGERGGVSSPELSFLGAVPMCDGGCCGLALADEMCLSGGVGGASSTGGTDDPDVDPDLAHAGIGPGMELDLTETGVRADMEPDRAGTGSSGEGDDSSLSLSG